MTTTTATDRQIAFINSLLDSVDTTQGFAIENTVKVMRDLVETAATNPERPLTKQQASRVIDMLKAQPQKPKFTAPATTSQELEDGMYMDAEGTVYKVQHAIHGSGRQYAKALVRDEYDDGWTFEYAKGAIYRLTADQRMTLEQAKEFGALYGTCCVCGRTLTNEQSIEAGIGPVCAGRF